MDNHEHGETDHELLSLWHVFVALSELRHRIKGLPDVFEKIELVNVYQAPGDDDGDWESHLKDQEQAWIITFLHYLKDGSRVSRKASGGGRWDGSTHKHKTHGKTSWHERKYNLVDRTNEQQIANKYTMFEYSPDEDKPKYALCRITTDKRSNAHDRPLSSSHQREVKEIDHGNKGHKGGNFENARDNNNQQLLERQLRGLRKHYSDANIEEVFNRIKSEKLPAVSPKERSTEAPVSNIRKRNRCTYTNTMAGHTSTQRQELAKVEMLESNSYGGDTTNLHDDTYRNCIEFGEQSSHHGNCNEKNAEHGSNPINLADFPESCTFEELYNSSDDHEMAEQNAVVQKPNQLSHNFNANSTVAMDYQNRIEPYPSTRNFATTDGRLDHQMVEPNAHFQEPKLYHNVNGNSTEPVLNNNHLLSWNRNKSAPGPSTSNYAAFMGGPDEQMFESDANVLEPNNSSCNFKTISTEPTEKGNHLPIYNQNTIAPGLDTNNNSTTEPEDMDWRSYLDFSD